MLINISISNFKSFKDRQDLTLLPTRGMVNDIDMNNSYTAFNYNKLKAYSTCVIYGPNNSGKSNTLLSFKALKWLVLNSANLMPGDELEPNEFFLLDKSTIGKPTTFEIDFIANDFTRYIYEVKFTKKRIIHENLYFFKKKQKKMRPALLFSRNENNIVEFGDFFLGEKKRIQQELRENQLFLSLGAKYNHSQLIPIYIYFRNHVSLWDFENDYEARMLVRHTNKLIADDEYGSLLENIEKIICNSDTGIQGLEFSEVSPERFVFPSEMPDKEKQKVIDRFKYSIKTKHRFFDNETEIGETTMSLQDQSVGTQKLFALSGALINALQNGGIFIVDELDKSLHYDLTSLLVKLFYNPKTNPHNTQLIFATHDASMLNSNLFSRDQIWMTQKDHFGKTELYSLSDIRGLRKEADKQKLYLSGRLGAKPEVDYDNINFKFFEDEK